MGLRLRKRIRIAKGVYINVSEKGVSSASFKAGGVTYTSGKNGSQLTTSIPGTGISYSEKLAGGNSSSKASRGGSSSYSKNNLDGELENHSSETYRACGLVLLFIGLISIFAFNGSGWFFL